MGLPSPQQAISQGQSVLNGASNFIQTGDLSQVSLGSVAGAVAGVVANLPAGQIKSLLSSIAAGAAAGAAIGSAVPGYGTVIGAAVGAIIGVAEDLLGVAPAAAQGDSRYSADRLCFPAVSLSGSDPLTGTPYAQFAALPGPVGINPRFLSMFYQSSTPYVAGADFPPGDTTAWATGNWAYGVTWNRPFCSENDPSCAVAGGPQVSSTTQLAAWCLAYYYAGIDPISIVQGTNATPLLSPVAATTPGATPSTDVPQYTGVQRMQAVQTAGQSAAIKMGQGAANAAALATAVALLDSWYGPSSSFQQPSESSLTQGANDYFHTCEGIFGSAALAQQQVQQLLQPDCAGDYLYYPISQSASGPPTNVFGQQQLGEACELSLSPAAPGSVNTYVFVPDMLLVGLAEIAVCALMGIGGLTPASADAVALHYVVSQMWLWANGQAEDAGQFGITPAMHPNFLRVLGNIQAKMQASTAPTGIFASMFSMALPSARTIPASVAQRALAAQAPKQLSAAKVLGLGIGAGAAGFAALVGYRAYRDNVPLSEAARGLFRGRR